MGSTFKLVENVARVLARIAVIVVVLGQGWFLNQFLYLYHKDKIWHLMILIDLTTAVLLSGCLWSSYHLIRRIKMARKKASRGEVGLSTEIAVPTPLIYFPAVAYFIYIAGILGRLICIFGDIFKQIQEEEYMQEAPNIIRCCVGVTAIIFFLFVLCHHNAYPNEERRNWLDCLAGAVTLDVLDTVEFMEIMFEKEVIKSEEETGGHSLVISFETSVMVFSCASLLLPCIALLDLSRSHFGARPVNLKIHLAYLIGNLLIVNVPYLVLRLIAWVHHSESVSVMLIKNVILIMAVLREIFHVAHRLHAADSLNLECVCSDFSSSSSSSSSSPCSARRMRGATTAIDAVGDSLSDVGKNSSTFLKAYRPRSLGDGDDDDEAFSVVTSTTSIFHLGGGGGGGGGGDGGSSGGKERKLNRTKNLSSTSSASADSLYSSTNSMLSLSASDLQQTRDEKGRRGKSRG